MAIIDGDAAEARLDHADNYCRGSGRTKGALGIPDKLREIIGFNAHFETAKSVAEGFGIAPITAHLAKRSEGHPEVKEKIDGRLKVVHDAALDKMMTALGVTTGDEIKALKVRARIAVAKDCASIIEKTSPKDTKKDDGARILIYAPQMQVEEAYDVVEVKASDGN